jgi:acyl-coenzyme A thioesterase 7
MVLPGDCGPKGVAFGGFVMKLMDNAAGCSAFRHCRKNVVTVAISAIDFVSWIRLGDICTIQSKVVFASTKTLEIEVVASVASIHTIDCADTLVAKGRFIFVSLNPEGKAIPVPPLKLETAEDFENAYLGQRRYEAGKKARAKAAASSNKTKS